MGIKGVVLKIYKPASICALLCALFLSSMPGIHPARAADTAWCHKFDWTTGNADGWSSSDGAELDSGTGWNGSLGLSTDIEISDSYDPSGFDIDHFELLYYVGDAYLNTDHVFQILDGGTTVYNYDDSIGDGESTGFNRTISADFSPVSSGGTLAIQVHGRDPVNATVESLLISGSGTPPFSENCPLAFPQISFEAIPSPTPVPSASAPTFAATLDLPTGPIYGFLATADANLSQAPADITSNGGLPVLPNQNGYQLFAYIKWLISPSSAAEIAGPFSDLIIHFAAFIGLSIFMSTVYVFIFIARILLRFVVWIITKIRMLF